MIRRIFSLPVFESNEDNFRAKFINVFAWFVILVLTAAALPYLTRDTWDFTVVVVSSLIAVMFVAIYLLHKGNINASGIIIVTLGWIGLGIQAYNADGVKDVVTSRISQLLCLQVLC